MSTTLAKPAQIERKWYVIDAAGKPLGRVAAREENITKAAQLLHVTQPTLSRQLMQLEEELGVKLFQRSNHCIVLTLSLIHI